MKLGVVCVHFHAAELTRRALAAVRAHSPGLDLSTVIVDNGSTPEEMNELRRCRTRIISTGENLGYAAGVNRGVEALGPDVDVLVLMNPDVFVEPGCLTALVKAIKEGAAVAGPRFFWDRVAGYQLPPTERCGRWPDLERILAGRESRYWVQRARSAWRRHAQLYWTSDQTFAGYDLSGALMAIDRSAWLKVGPFDEGYPLYFEETDWLRRCSRAGLPGCFVGRAHAVHLYAQSTPREPRARQWFAESQQRFRRRHYGGVWDHLVRALARLKTPPPSGETVPEVNRVAPVPRNAGWIEISPSPNGFPAAAMSLEDPERKPKALISDDLWRQMAAGDYFLRALDAEGGERLLGRVRR